MLRKLLPRRAYIARNVPNRLSCLNRSISTTGGGGGGGSGGGQSGSNGSGGSRKPGAEGGGKKRPSRRSENSNNGQAAGSKGSSESSGIPEAGNNLNQLQKALQVIESSLISGKQLAQMPKPGSELLCLSVNSRPLFPGFYKTITIRNPKLISAVRETLQKSSITSTPYVTVFLNRERQSFTNQTQNVSAGSGIVGYMDDVYPVGVLAQISNAMPGPEDSLTLLLYPSKRVVIKKFLPPLSTAESNESQENMSEEDSDQGEEFKPLKRPHAPPSMQAGKETVEQYREVARVVVEELHDEEMGKEELSANANPATSWDEIVPDSQVDEQQQSQNNKRPSRALIKQLMETFNDIIKLNPLVREQVNDFMRSFGAQNGLYENPTKLADFAAAMSDAEPHELQQVLQSTRLDDRLKKSLLLLKKELANARLQNEISKDVERLISERDREYFLQERLKNIQKELGMETIQREKLADKFRSRVTKLAMPEAVKKVYDEEMGKLVNLKPAAQEFNITSNYLDWLTLIPWGKRTAENFDLHHAQNMLDKDHYGLKDVKERILEFIAVGKMRGTVEGKILCLVGPPGVGKTSIGKSISHALGREFYRFSVGGLYDVAEIKGHRRTYVGAMPGKLVQALKSVQTENPVILIDEVDKLAGGLRGAAHGGDPSSALLEVLDPEQNQAFLDHYMDVPIDLSKVLFVCTANVLDTIPRALLDRMEIIRLSGYLSEEKKAIALNYLAPEARKLSGLAEHNVSLADSAVESLIHQYCRENGVRNLKKHIEKIYRKAAFKVVSSDETTPQSITIDSDNLKEFVGSPVYTKERLYPKAPAGVVMGLAYSSLGGSTLYIESVTDSPVTESSKPGFAQTGNMGDVMKESSRIAHSFAKSFLQSAVSVPERKFFDRASIHLHVPEGAIPKDGPSAGIAMCTSLLSLALNRPLAIDVAMTGELTLTGKVLRIGGVKEKVMAAKRAGVAHLILPLSNKADYEELDKNITDGLQSHFVDHYADVYRIVFGQG